MTKTKMRWALCAILMLASMSAPTLSHADARSWRYVVPPFQSADSIEPPSPAPAITPFGQVTVVPQGRSVTVRIADDVHPNGSFLFSICQPNQAQAGDSFCGRGSDDISTGDVCYTGPRTLRGLVPGNPVHVTLWWATSPCPDAPITGTLTVTY